MPSLQATILADNHVQPLCQLRDRTPNTNWTLLAVDVPAFFADPRKVLAKYEEDPLQRVPTTHAVGTGVPSRAPASEARRRTLLADGAAAAAGAATEPASGEQRAAR